jgi:aspartyl/asparaginyl beta-hydroxylase (cupin superfamily)
MKINENLTCDQDDKKQPKPFYETEEFPQMKLFDDNYKQILEELYQVIENEAQEDSEYLEKSTKDEPQERPRKFFEPWCESNLYEESNPNGWDVAPMMINYKKDERRCVKVPFLMSLVNQIPGLITVSFSMLKPGTWIVPHKGYENYATVLLRYHQGLVIPKGDLGIRVDKKIKCWEEGKSFIFDDSLTHEAWNFSDKDRYVLIIDFARTKEGKLSSEKIEFEICSLTEEVKQFLKD